MGFFAPPYHLIANLTFFRTKISTKAPQTCPFFAPISGHTTSKPKGNSFEGADHVIAD
jgi:hypothetical protein